VFRFGLDINDKIITLRKEGGNSQAFNISQVKPFENDVFLTLQNHFRSGQAPEPPQYTVHLSEVIKPWDPRGELFDAAMEKEITGLIQKGTWRLCYAQTFLMIQMFLLDDSFLPWKTAGPKKKYTRLDTLYKDSETNWKHPLYMTRPRQGNTQPLLVGLAAVFGFRHFSTDVMQAYLQSASKLMRDVFIETSQEKFELGLDHVLQLLKPLYGMPDSGDYWGKTFSSHLKYNLGLTTTCGDPASFKSISSQLSGLCATYVDASLHSGNREYQLSSEQTMNKFACREHQWDNVTFAGMEIASEGEQGFAIHQKAYIPSLATIHPGSTFKQYRSLRAKLAWLTNSRPDIFCAINQAAQVTEYMFNADTSGRIMNIKSVVHHVQKSPDFSLRYPNLDLKTLRIQVYSDASYNNNADG
jgi:hypothetical protein